MADPFAIQVQVVREELDKLGSYHEAWRHAQESGDVEQAALSESKVKELLRSCDWQMSDLDETIAIITSAGMDGGNKAEAREQRQLVEAMRAELERIRKAAEVSAEGRTSPARRKSQDVDDRAAETVAIAHTHESSSPLPIDYPSPEGRESRRATERVGDDDEDDDVPNIFTAAHPIEAAVQAAAAFPASRRAPLRALQTWNLVLLLCLLAALVLFLTGLASGHPALLIAAAVAVGAAVAVAVARRRRAQRAQRAEADNVPSIGDVGPI